MWYCIFLNFINMFLGYIRLLIMPLFMTIFAILWKCVYLLIYLADLIFLLNVGDHDNNWAAFLPNHPPEISHCVYSWTLSGNVYLLLPTIALWKGRDNLLSQKYTIIIYTSIGNMYRWHIQKHVTTQGIWHCTVLSHMIIMMTISWLNNTSKSLPRMPFNLAISNCLVSKNLIA